MKTNLHKIRCFHDFIYFRVFLGIPPRNTLVCISKRTDKSVSFLENINQICKRQDPAIAALCLLSMCCKMNYFDNFSVKSCAIIFCLSSISQLLVILNIILSQEIVRPKDNYNPDTHIN